MRYYDHGSQHQSNVGVFVAIALLAIVIISLSYQVSRLEIRADRIEAELKSLTTK